MKEVQMRLRCGACDHGFGTTGDKAGLAVRCPGCKRVIRIPGLFDEPVARPVEPAAAAPAARALARGTAPPPPAAPPADPAVGFDPFKDRGTRRHQHARAAGPDVAALLGYGFKGLLVLLALGGLWWGISSLSGDDDAAPEGREEPDRDRETAARHEDRSSPTSRSEDQPLRVDTSRFARDQDAASTSAAATGAAGGRSGTSSVSPPVQAERPGALVHWREVRGADRSDFVSLEGTGWIDLIPHIDRSQGWPGFYVATDAAVAVSGDAVGLDVPLAPTGAYELELVFTTLLDAMIIIEPPVVDGGRFELRLNSTANAQDFAGRTSLGKTGLRIGHEHQLVIAVHPEAGGHRLNYRLDGEERFTGVVPTQTAAKNEPTASLGVRVYAGKQVPQERVYAAVTRLQIRPLAGTRLTLAPAADREGPAFTSAAIRRQRDPHLSPLGPVDLVGRSIHRARWDGGKQVANEVGIYLSHVLAYQNQAEADLAAELVEFALGWRPGQSQLVRMREMLIAGRRPQPADFQPETDAQMSINEEQVWRQGALFDRNGEDLRGAPLNLRLASRLGAVAMAMFAGSDTDQVVMDRAAEPVAWPLRHGVQHIPARDPDFGVDFRPPNGNDWKLDEVDPFNDPLFLEWQFVACTRDEEGAYRFDGSRMGGLSISTQKITQRRQVPGAAQERERIIRQRLFSGIHPRAEVDVATADPHLVLAAWPLHAGDRLRVRVETLGGVALFPERACTEPLVRIPAGDLPGGGQGTVDLALERHGDTVILAAIDPVRGIVELARLGVLRPVYLGIRAPPRGSTTEVVALAFAPASAPVSVR